MPPRRWFSGLLYAPRMTRPLAAEKAADRLEQFPSAIRGLRRALPRRMAALQVAGCGRQRDARDCA
jgi:hypothetical protein